MQIIKLAILSCCVLFTATCFSQSKKVEKLLAASTTLTAGAQILQLTDYTIYSSMNSRAVVPDPTAAGSNIIIKFTGVPETGSDAVALTITFVPVTNNGLYDKPEYVASAKTIYLTMPVTQYPVIISEMERTIDKTNGKKLKGIWLDAGAGSSIGSVSIY